MLKTCYPLVLFYSHIDPAALEACVSHDVGVANQWYHERGSQWGGGFYGYRLKFWLFYGYRLIFSSYG